MTSRDYLTGRLALAEGATEGEWDFAIAPAEGSDETKAEYMAGALTEVGPLYTLWVPATAGQSGGYLVPAITGDGPNARNNAAFIADARTSNPVMAAALIAVLDLHTMVEYVGANATGPVCDECSPPPGDRSIPYPCPTVRLITDALGADK